MEKKTSKKTNTKAKKGVKKVEEKNNITLDEINLKPEQVTKGNIVIGGTSIEAPKSYEIKEENSYMANDVTTIIQNKIAELKGQKAKITGTLRIYTVQDSYNFQIQVLEELLKEVK